MAISPNVLRNNLEDELNIIEQLIDEKLRLQKMYSNQVTIDPPKEMTYTHYQKIRERYVRAGWNNVTYRDDQRDGPSLTFSMVTPSVNGWMDR